MSNWAFCGSPSYRISLEVDFIDESEVLTPADEHNHIWKHDFKIPFVCGARDLGEALRRIGEGASLIRTKGEAGSGNIVEAVRHMRTIMNEIKMVKSLDKEELMYTAKKIGAPFEILQKVAELGKLPVPNFAAGGIATPADASLMMQLGAETVFVGSGIFKSDDPAARAKAVVEATTNYNDSAKVAKASTGLKKAMKGLDMNEIAPEDRLQERLVIKIGVLELQGGFALHHNILSQLGIGSVAVKSEQDLNLVDGLIIPGGESTTISLLVDSLGLRSSIIRFSKEYPIMGTCAGLIMMASRVSDSKVNPLGLLDIFIDRNAYGKQIRSKIKKLILILTMIHFL